MDSPRGRIYLMKALAEGRLDLDSDAVRHLDACLGCRGCETACPSGVHYGRLIEDTRSYIEGNYRRETPDLLRRGLISAIFPYPARLRILISPLRLIERAGLRPLLNRMMPRSIRSWLELLPPLASTQTSASISSPAPSSSAQTVVVHHGCVAQVLARSEIANAEALLARAGYRVIHLDRTICCGALDLHSGNRARALDFARANVRALAASGANAIVSTASGCSTAIAEYGMLLKDDDHELSEKARLVASRVTDLSNLLLKRLPMPRSFSCTVTYHDACHLAHGLGVRDAPRELLRSIPGLKLVEMVDADMCCGSAGSYNLTEPEMANALARRKADSTIATRADYVVLANPGCEFQIASELRRRGSNIRVMHLADFLAMAIRTSDE